MRTLPAHPLKRRQRSSDLIADELRSDIKCGAMAPGQPLRQEELARRFGVGRLPIRVTLLRLEGEGQVAVYPNHSAYVASLSAAEVREIYDQRVLLESDLLKRAIRDATRKLRGGFSVVDPTPFAPRARRAL